MATDDISLCSVAARATSPAEELTEGPHDMREACTLTQDFVLQKGLADRGLGVGTRVVLVMSQSEASCKIRLFSRRDQAGKRSSKASTETLQVEGKTQNQFNFPI